MKLEPKKGTGGFSHKGNRENKKNFSDLTCTDLFGDIQNRLNCTCDTTRTAIFARFGASWCIFKISCSK